MRNSIDIQGLSKKFRLYPKGRPTTFQEALVNRFKGIKPKSEFWALKNVSFYVEPGNMLGVIGKNGAGKSTLLKILGRVLNYDAGIVNINGRIGGLLELGAGFHPDLTGRENIFVNGVVSGLTRAQVKERFDEIVTFAELEGVIDYPLRTYSSGMKMRLGFSVAAFTDPDILLIDEVLAVGDLSFRRKCFERIEQFKEMGKTIVLVTHDLQQVKMFCDRAIWLKDGNIEASGKPEEVVSLYQQYNKQNDAQISLTAINDEKPFNPVNGMSPLDLHHVRLLNSDSLPVDSFSSGDCLQIEINYNARAVKPSAIFSFSIYNQKNQLCCRFNTSNVGQDWPVLNGKGFVLATIPSLPLAKGKYRLDVGIYSEDWQVTYAYKKRMRHFIIKDDAKGEHGVVSLPHQWELVQESTLVADFENQAI